ncbi:MAG: hypothetical protein ACXIU8_12770 [Alkalilacustris sp.]
MFQRYLTTPTLAAALALGAAPAHAEGPELSFFGLFGTDLISGGEPLTAGRPGAELGLEAGFGPGFAGVAARTLRDGRDRSEAELFGGLRFDLGAAELEAGVARAWANRSGAADTELFLGVGAEATPGLVLLPEAAYAPAPSDWTDVSATAAFDLTDRLALSARLGRVPADRITYADLGLIWALDASSGVDLRLHRSDEVSARAVLALVTELNLR